MTELECIDIRNRDMMKAVVTLCPRLRQIEFDSPKGCAPLKEEEIIGPEELASFLTAQDSVWPEVIIIKVICIFNRNYKNYVII